METAVGYFIFSKILSASQDAHNCIPEFDEDTAMFAVYDGHGGKTPSFICRITVGETIS